MWAAKSLPAICRIFGITLYSKINGLYTVDIDDAYDSAFDTTIMSCMAPYARNGEIIAMLGREVRMIDFKDRKVRFIIAKTMVSGLGEDDDDGDE